MLVALGVIAATFLLGGWRWTGLLGLLLLGTGLLAVGGKKKSNSVAAAGYLVVLIGWPWLFFTPQVAVRVVYVTGPVVCILLLVGGGWLGGHQPRALAEIRNSVIQRANVQNKGPVFQARYVATKVFGLIACGIAWPSVVTWLTVLWLRARRGTGGSQQTRFGALGELYPFDLPLLGVNLAAAVLVSALHDGRVLDATTGGWIFWTLILSTLFWAVAATVAPQAFVTTLRRAEGNPYLQFLAAGLAMVGIFGLGFTALNSAGAWLDAVPVSATIKQVLAFQEVFERSGGDDLVGLTRASSGALLYLLIARGVLDFNSFERTQPDAVAMANLWTRAGRPEMAVRHLQKVTMVDSESLAARSLSLLALGRVKESVEVMREVVRLSEKAGWSVIDPYRELFAVAPLVAELRVSETVVVEWLDSGVDDASFCINVVAIANLHGRERVKALLEERGGSERYPLSWAWLHTIYYENSTVEYEQAMKLFDQTRSVAGLPGFLAGVGILVERGDERVEEELRQLVAEISVRARELKTFEHVAAAYNLILLIRELAQHLGTELYSLLVPLSTELEARLPADRNSLFATEIIRASVVEGLSEAGRQG